MAAKSTQENVSPAQWKLDRIKHTDRTAESLNGMRAIVTGANSGIGYYTALDLTQRGATVILACRSLQRGSEAAQKINSMRPSGHAICMQLDLNDLHSVRAFAKAYQHQHDTLNILVNNAGLNTMDNPDAKTVQGFEMCFGVNYLGHFLLTEQLLGLLRSSGTAEIPSRIVNVSSVMHRFAHSDFEKAAYESGGKAYGVSKLCNLLHTRELQKRCREEGDHIKVIAVHPGGVNTNIWRTLPKHLLPIVNAIWKVLLLTPEQGASTSIRAAVDTSLKGGEYLTPYWYPRQFPSLSGYFELLSCYAGALEARPSKLAQDDALASKLWEFSRRLVDQSTM